MTKLIRSAVATLAFLGFASCAEPRPCPPDSVASVGVSDLWPDTGCVMVRWPAPDRTVAVTVSNVIRNRQGLLARIVSITNVYDTGKWHAGPSQGVYEVDAHQSWTCGADAFGQTTVVHPREGLAWSEVREEAELVLETETGQSAEVSR